MSEIIRSNDDLLLEQEAQTAELQTLNTNVAKEAKQDDANALLTTIDGDTDAINTAVTSIDAKVSTEAKQDTIISELQDIEAALGGQGNTGTETTVTASATSVTLLAANTSRREVYIRNDSAQKLYISLTGTATTATAIVLKKDDIFTDETYTGIITGIWAGTPTGSAYITEITKV